MARQVFSWFPNVGSSIAIKPEVEQTKFGDGYELRIAKGINFMPEKWSVRFTNVEATSKAILAFFRAHGGVNTFDWTTPNGDLGVFVCREWSASRLKGGAMDIDCSFEQIFEA